MKRTLCGERALLHDYAVAPMPISANSQPSRAAYRRELPVPRAMEYQNFSSIGNPALRTTSVT
jgi:hypothetical protein